MVTQKILSFTALLALCSKGLAVSNSTAKCIPSDPCWPSPTTWTSLNETLTGRVLPTTLPSSVCPEGGPGSETWIVNATNAKDVQATLNFANEHNLKINVNNTGHAGYGRSSTCGALFIATGEMKGVDFHESYTPQSCSANHSHMVATLGAGQQDDETFQALAKYNAVTVGGTFDTVGIVGWATGGGHGWLTSSYGMGADNIFEFEIVTPTGDILVANECQNSDIFWATRGGGGGTFGVITKITMKAYPMPRTAVWLWNIQGRNNTDAKEWWRLVASLHANMPAVNEAGFQGYYTIAGAKNGPLAMGGYFMAYDKSNSSLTTAMENFLAPARESSNLVSSTMSNLTTYSRWIDAYNGLPKQTRDSSSGPGGVISTTRLLTADSLTQDIEASARMFETIGPQAADYEKGMSSHILAGALIASPKAVDSALNPAWRKATVHMIVKSAWDTALPGATVREFQKSSTNRTGRAMRGLSPDSGCYVNEVDKYEPNFQEAMYGPNYPRLRAIKAKYDPENLLWCRRCIGSEEWKYDERDGRLEKRATEDVWPNFAYGF
ncbi:hypothetical protein AG0111_0g9634 [Alternaria gaisen]|uniref:Uncharacterized protein n=1 Tax=Alternaria gaisen TaxID=167740 RepID=A0ACB6FD51_9PLEO|nr:hypothetical protein AG0111_0g9634 [Alternaria gaisen]